MDEELECQPTEQVEQHVKMQLVQFYHFQRQVDNISETIQKIGMNIGLAREAQLQPIGPHVLHLLTLGKGIQVLRFHQYYYIFQMISELCHYIVCVGPKIYLNTSVQRGQPKCHFI